MARQKIFEEESDNEIDIPKEKRRLETKSYDYSVDYVNNLMTTTPKKIVLEVPFQRNRIWKEDRASQLIESLIMNVPIPPLYFSEEEDGTWIVLDGLQRLHSIHTFFKNDFSLRRLEITRELEGKKYADLPPKAKNLLNDALLRINIIKKESHPNIKYDIFMRLNKGAVSLNNQELRNCLYRGSLNDTLRKIVKDKDVLATLNLKKPHARYLDIEFLLRFLAFHASLKKNSEGYYLYGYKGSLKSFINNYMEKHQNPNQAELDKFSFTITETFKKVNTILGYKGLLNPATKSSQINKALADVILLSFERKSLELLKSKKSEIVNLRQELLSDELFVQAITRRTSDHSAIKTRLDRWFGRFDDVFEI